MKTLLVVVLGLLPICLTTGCAQIDERGSVLHFGASTHAYAYAFSPTRHMVEWPIGWLRVFYYNGTDIHMATVRHGKLVGPPQRVNHCPNAPGFSITLVDDILYLVYSDGNHIAAFLRTATRQGTTLRFTDPRQIIAGKASFSVQCVSVAMSPEKRLTLVYRGTEGSPNRFPVYIMQANDRLGTQWGEPILVSSPTQYQRSAGYAGTSGTVFWPGGQMVVILSGDILYANFRTPGGGWRVHEIDAEYNGTHDWSGTVVGETLYVAYRGVSGPGKVSGWLKTGGTMRWIQYNPNTGWSAPHDTNAPAAVHSSAMGIGPDGIPLVFGYDDQEGIRYTKATTNETAIAHHIAPRPNFAVSGCWLAVPERFVSSLSCGWVEGSSPPYQIYFWVGPSFARSKHARSR